MIRKHLSTFVKVGITILGLIVVLSQIDTGTVSQILLQANSVWLGIGFLLITVSMAVRAYRWELLLHGIGLHVPFSRLVELYFVGSFFNAFLPSGFGGDVVRVLEINKNVDLDVAGGTVFLDRLTGLIMLFVIGLVLLPFRAGLIPVPLRWLILLGSLGSIVGMALLLEHSLICRLGSWLPGPLSPVGHGLLAKTLKAVQACGIRAVFGALGVSVFFNLMLTGWWWTTGKALGVNIGFGYYLFAVPILSLALMAPSVGGLGVRELIAPTLFAAAGIGGEQAVSLSLLVFLLERVSGLLGAPIYLYRNLQPSANYERMLTAKGAKSSKKE